MASCSLRINVAVFIVGLTLCCARMITFRASHSVIRLADDVPKQSFQQWFSGPDTPLSILELNPALKKVERISDNCCRGYLSPIQFPGLNVSSIVDFDVNFDGSVLTVSAEGNSLMQIYEGRQLLKSLVSKLPLPTVRSRTVISVADANNLITNMADLEVAFPFPSWFPFPADTVEQTGSEIIKRKLKSDLDELLDNIIVSYERWFVTSRQIPDKIDE